MSAHDALSDAQFVGHKELAGMYSGDHDEPMSRVLPRMRDIHADWQAEQDGGLPADEIPHYSQIEHGGPDGYVAHLAKDIRKNGMREPIKVRGGNVIIDGQHRALAAMKLGLDRVPVKHIR